MNDVDAFVSISQWPLDVLIEKRAEWQAYEPINVAAAMMKKERLAMYHRAIAQSSLHHSSDE